MPPGWPVFQAFSMSSASAPRTSPTMMRSGRRRSVERTRSASETTPRLGAQSHAIGRGALQLARVLDQDDPLVERRRSRPAARWPAWSCRSWCRRRPGYCGGRARPVRSASAWIGDHDAVGNIVGQRIDPGRRLADREARRQRYGRQQALETLAAISRQFGADDRIVGMGLGAHMGGDSRMIRSTSAAASRSPVSIRPSPSRSSRRGPSGLTITSMTRGSAKRGRRSPAPWRCAAWRGGVVGFRHGQIRAHDGVSLASVARHHSRVRAGRRSAGRPDR